MGDKAALSADEYFAGKTAAPIKISLENGFTPKRKTELTPSAAKPASSATAAPVAAKKTAGKVLSEKDVKELKDLLAQKEVTVEAIEAKLAALKSK